ncbi:ABC transporter ATP-binding protein [Martelella alba]|uniref:ABC transporter ATP-binding protein n=1 Tax=Martelella alba TaxID=2590451 RepID=A0A506UDG6_9HYPH|nr:ABC transporter ATP-binding protein [Martelella alba]TPW32483.1 ABC transporter ATP-binding protein [Martelella alba]
MIKLLEIHNLTREFGLGNGIVKAVDNVSLSLEEGQILGIVGESGSGKSTLARIVMALDRPTAGNVLLNGEDLFALPAEKLRRMRANFQMVFQDPYGSLDPRHRVGRIIAEPLYLEKNAPTGKARRERVGKLLEEVGLAAADMDKYPHEFSGGQRQRIAIARALITRPKLLVADEATSALDLTVQAQILKLILDMRKTHGISVLFITHNIGVVDEICDRVAVMQAGKLVEYGQVRDVLDNPREAYTKKLLSAEPTLREIGRKKRAAGEPPPS